MDMSGEYRIPASRQVVWDALNDPAVLKASIAGCEELEKNDEGGFAAKVRAKVGPVSARFTGKVTIVDPDPPNGYRIEGEGQGGAAGFAKGGATVKLADDGGATVLTYEANASVGGKLAQIGSRLIDGTAKKMADDFFAKFSEIVAEQAGEAEPAVEAPADPAAAEPVAASAAVKTAEEPAGQAPASAAAPAAGPAPGASASAGEPAAKGIPQWAWIAGAAVVIFGLIIALT